MTNEQIERRIERKIDVADACRTAFLDLDDNEAEVSAPKMATAPALDLAS